MNGSLGQFIRARRAQLDLRLGAVAEQVGVSRSTLSRWERGRFHVPERFLEPLAKALQVELTDLAGRTVRSTSRLPAALQNRRVKPPRFPEYQIEGTVEQMLALSEGARTTFDRAKELHPDDALHEEMRDRFPRDSHYELYAGYRYLAAGATLVDVSLLALGFRRLVIQPKTWRFIGDVPRPALLLRLENGYLLVLPQVSMAVVPQSKERRADFLLMYVEGRSRVWIDLEIDIALNLRNANDDARRAVGLGLVRMSRTWTQLDRPDFVLRIIEECSRILKAQATPRRRAA